MLVGPIGTKFSKADAKAQYWISLCISEADQERISELPTAKQIWESLKAKYKAKLQGTGRQYLLEYVNYRMEPGTTIEDAWVRL
ncbi:hypothetical protein SLS57_004847 [Botryosphaeria dothidea]